MEHGDVDFGGRHSTGEGGVGVAVEDDAVEVIVEQHLLDAANHAGGLEAMGAGADPEVEVGLGDAQLVEEDLRHVGVVVLAGVEDGLLDLRREKVAHRTADGGGFDDLGACPDDGEYLHD